MATVHSAVAAAVRDSGTDTVFGVLGDANMLYVTDFIAAGGRYVGSVDERGAVQMAAAYARVGDRVGVATVTHGPGLTNALTALVDAARARTPLVLLTGDTPGVRDYLQQIDIPAVVGPAGALHQRVRHPDDAADEVATAVRRARALGLPVVLDVPFELLRLDSRPGRPGSAPATQAVAPDEEAMDAALGVVASAQRPLVLAGRGAALAGARAELVELAAAIGAPLATTLLGRDLFRGEPFDLGVVGTVAHDVAAETVAAADCVVAFGAGLNRYTTAHGSLFDGRAVVQVDTDPERLGRHHPVTAAVVGDARVVASRMTEQLREAGIAPSGFRSAALRTRLAARDPRADFADASTDSVLDARAAMIALDELFPQDRIVVTDVGRYVLAPWRYVHVPRPLDFTHTGSFGAIGLGVAGAVGASAADPSRPTLGIVGDGGGMIGIAEFSTAVRHRLPLVIAVVNDGCYGAEWDQLEGYGVDPKHALIDWPEFADLGRAMGGYGLTARSVRDLEQVAEHVRDGRLPLLVDIKTDPVVRIGEIR